MRSGGGFDPEGCRASDVVRGADVVELMAGHPGRWVMVTLTVDRSQWLDPASCYQRVNERVREVTRVVSLEGVHVTALEMQGKTGEGWPHWHVTFWAPDDRTEAEIWAKARRAWTITTEHVDQDTGEVTRSREFLSCAEALDVSAARDAKAVGIYQNKYILKPWPAVPRWMGESTRQLRKLRISSRSFDWLESVGRHVRHRGSRRSSSSSRRRARPLFDRMARSCAQMAVFRRTSDGFKFLTMVPLPASRRGAEILGEVGARPIRLGKWSAMRWTIDGAGLHQLRCRRDELVKLQAAQIRGRRVELAEEWAMMQERRQLDELAESAPPPLVSWDLPPSS